MPAMPIATDVNAIGQTEPIDVPESRCYTVQISWEGGTCDAKPEFSVDGVTFFNVTPVPPNLSSTGSVKAHRFTDMPVTKMRLNVASLSEGVTINATVVAV